MTLAVFGTSVVLGVPEDPAVGVAFTGRGPGSGGNLSLVVGQGDVAAARREAVSTLGAQPSRAVFMQQVHGGAVAVVGELHAGRGLDDYGDAIPGVDALVTTTVDLPLVALAADCVPVVLVDPGNGVAAVHAGRGGVMNNVVPNALQRLAPAGCANVVAFIGPAIGGCCYEVGEALAGEVGSRWPQARATTTWGTPALDVPAAVVAQLQSAGVARIERVGSCTRCSGEDYFSHRAAGAGVAPHGRQGAIVVRMASPPLKQAKPVAAQSPLKQAKPVAAQSDAPAPARQTPSLQSP